MDSLTQITLGAAVGEAVAGKKAGNKAILWGAVAGTIPDLDVLFNPLFDSIDQLSVHRGFSHSILFSIIFSPLLAYLISKIHKNSEAKLWDWTKLVFWSVITHIALDCFTTYGTQVFYPFSNFQVSFSTIFVIDPLYTLPLLAGVIVVLFFKRNSKKRRIINYIGIGVSSAYIVFTMVNKLYVNSIFVDSINKQGINYTKFVSAPAPFTNILWRALFVTKNGYVEGYYSLLDDGKEIIFRPIGKNDNLITEIKESRAIEKLDWFSEGYYTITEKDNFKYFNDLRFGSLNGWSTSNSDFVFSFKLIENVDEITFQREFPEFKISGEIWESFVKRILGR